MGWVNQSKEAIALLKSGAARGTRRLAVARVQPDSTLTHPANPPGGYPDHQSKRRHVTSDNCSRADKAVFPQSNPTENGRVGPNRGTAAHERLLILRLSRHMAPGIYYVREHAARPTEDVVLQHNTFVDRNVVLNLHIIAQPRPRHYHHVLPQVAALTDYRARHDMAEVPYLGTQAYDGAVVDIGGFVDVVVRLPPFMLHCSPFTLFK